MTKYHHYFLQGCAEAPVLLLKLSESDEDDSSKPVASDEEEPSRTDGKKKKKKPAYTIDDLKDLQSKLTLVAGKTKQEKEGQKNEVEYFVEVGISINLSNIILQGIWKTK